MPPEQLGSQGPGYPGLPGREKTSGGKEASQELVGRPELEVFGLAMLGGGMVFGSAHPYGKLVVVWGLGWPGVLTEIDYPWGELGEATMVDVGGGVGKFRPFFILLLKTSFRSTISNMVGWLTVAFSHMKQAVLTSSSQSSTPNSASLSRTAVLSYNKQSTPYGRRETPPLWPPVE